MTVTMDMDTLLPSSGEPSSVERRWCGDGEQARMRGSCPLAREVVVDSRVRSGRRRECSIELRAKLKSPKD